MKTKIFYTKLFYAYKFISQCLPIYAFYTILFIERGMSLDEIALLIALWSAFAIIFEMPSGILADRWNRRNMLCLSALLQGLCFVVWYFSHGFLLFAVGFVFWGISGAFASGTEEAFIYDNLKADGREKDFTEVYGRAQLMGNVGTIFGIVSAGALASFISISVIALISAAVCFLNALLVLMLREKNYYSAQPEDGQSGFWGTFKEAGELISRSKIALLSILFLIFFASLSSYLDEFDALIINDFGLDSLWVSAILAVRFVFASLGDVIAPVIQKKNPKPRIIFLVNTLGCVFLALFAILWNKYAILCFGLSTMLMAATEVLLVDALQNEIKDEGRATVMSIYGFGQNVVMVGFSLLYALLAGLMPLQQTYLILSVYGVIGGLGFYLVCKMTATRAMK